MDYEISEYDRDGYTISTDRSRLDLDVVHGYLSRSYWCAGVPRTLLEKAIRNSFCLGLYHDGGQVGFARVVTDFARFGNLCDVFVLKPHRGKGLGTWLVQTVIESPLLQELRSISLGTRDAHEVYVRCGFQRIDNASAMMIFKREMSWWRSDMVAE